jgi:cysteinyl-tRNA synthetase
LNAHYVPLAAKAMDSCNSNSRNANSRNAPVNLCLALASAAALLGTAIASHSAGLSASSHPAAAPLVVHAQSQPDASIAARRRRLGAVHNWGYWLSTFDVDGVHAAPHDLMVVDSEVSANNTFSRERTPEEVTRMKQRPDRSTRVLLAYLSIGEAERYRPYWRQEWYDPLAKPAWLGGENRKWVGNFAVQYWDEAWQRLIFGYLDNIVAQGFDGVYLDRADAFFDWQKSHVSARSDMVDLIARLTAHARKKNPNFLIVMQNAEELIEEPLVLDAIDGIAKEDLLYGVRRAEEANKPDDVEWSIELLQKAQKAGRKVLVVEYLKDPAKMAAAASRILEEGFVPYFAPRKLNCLNPPVVPTESGALPAASCR